VETRKGQAVNAAERLQVVERRLRELGPALAVLELRLRELGPVLVNNADQRVAIGGELLELADARAARSEERAVSGTAPVLHVRRTLPGESVTSGTLTLCGRDARKLQIWARPITLKALRRPVVRTACCRDCVRALRLELEAIS
jgi:hypothetical protein